MTQQLPALALGAALGHRHDALELAREIEQRGFAGIYCASFGDGIGLCLSIAHVTSTIPFGTAIANIYTRHPIDMANAASYIQEISSGRFRLGIGVSHAPNNARLGVDTGKPLSDIRTYVERMRAVEDERAPLPPIVLATLRKKMTALSSEIAQGAVWANAIRSHMAESLQQIATEKLDGGFFIGDMLAVCIDDDERAAEAVIRRYLTGYLMLPNYRNYWREAGYGEDMDRVEAAIERGEGRTAPDLVSDAWLRDVALFGSASTVRDGLDEWFVAGMKTPILVPSSTQGRQQAAYREVFEALA
jgi:alkanesulfonate monooxygenase SsuD/methylene tetrahydromethanopterin reductase-like flavin-dependent oxidoreductase (luciferase family)